MAKRGIEEVTSEYALGYSACPLVLLPSIQLLMPDI